MAFGERGEGKPGNTSGSAGEDTWEKNETEWKEKLNVDEQERKGSRRLDLRELKEKLENTNDASEILRFLGVLGRDHIETVGLKSRDSEHLPEMLETLAKDFENVKLTETQKGLVSKTIEGLQNWLTWQLQDLKSMKEVSAEKLIGYYKFNHDVDIASLQLYNFLHRIKSDQEHR